MYNIPVVMSKEFHLRMLALEAATTACAGNIPNCSYQERAKLITELADKLYENYVLPHSKGY
jgi:hypothetical protein